MVLIKIYSPKWYFGQRSMGKLGIIKFLLGSILGNNIIMITYLSSTLLIKFEQKWTYQNLQPKMVLWSTIHGKVGHNQISPWIDPW